MLARKRKIGKSFEAISGGGERWLRGIGGAFFNEA
jgi:hypothetical protein